MKLSTFNSLLVVRVERGVRWLSWGPPQNRVQNRNYVDDDKWVRLETIISFFFCKRARPGLNQGPADLQSAALPLSYVPNWLKQIHGFLCVFSHIKQASPSVAWLWTWPESSLAISGINGRLAEYIVAIDVIRIDTQFLTGRIYGDDRWACARGGRDGWLIFFAQSPATRNRTRPSDVCKQISCIPEKEPQGIEPWTFSHYHWAIQAPVKTVNKVDSEGIRTPAGRAQWISSPSP